MLYFIYYYEEEIISLVLTMLDILCV